MWNQSIAPAAPEQHRLVGGVARAQGRRVAEARKRGSTACEMAPPALSRVRVRQNRRGENARGNSGQPPTRPRRDHALSPGE